MKRCAMCLTPAAAAAPRAWRPALDSDIRIATCSDGGRSSTSSRNPVRWRARSSSERHAGTTSTKRKSAARSSASWEASSIALSSSARSGLPRVLGSAAARSRPTARIASSELCCTTRRYPRRGAAIIPRMRIAVAADERTGVADAAVAELRVRGQEVVAHGARAGPAERDDWAWCAEAAARDVADGRAEQAVVCCWTGTGASIAANKVPGVRAALCADAATADGARRWNDANVLALSLRTTSQAELAEILDAWFAATPSAEEDDRANVGHLADIEH